MKKKLLPLAIAAAMAPGFASAADVSGFVDITYTIGDDQPAGTTTPSTTEGKFGANGEIDFSASPADGVTVRVDVDLAIATNGGANASAVGGGPSDSAVIEQAFFAWGATEGVTVIGGVFNNPMGLEGQDAPDMWGTNAGVVNNILNHQTTLYGNNVAGLAVAGAVGPATVTVAYLNELSQANEENSIAIVVNMSPMEGLDLEFGTVTAADQNKSTLTTLGSEGATNFNVAYAIPGVEGLSVGFDYLTGGKVVDSAYEITANYSTGAFGFGLRLEEVGYEASGSADSERTTFHASYQVASNLVAILEVADGDNKNPTTAVTGIEADGLTTLELIATF